MQRNSLESRRLVQADEGSRVKMAPEQMA